MASSVWWNVKVTTKNADCCISGKNLPNCGAKAPFLTWWATCFLSFQVSKAELSPEALSSLRAATGYQGNTLSRVRISASKPNFEVGSSSQLKLSFGKKTPKPGTVGLYAHFLLFLSAFISTAVKFKENIRWEVCSFVTCSYHWNDTGHLIYKLASWTNLYNIVIVSAS